MLYGAVTGCAYRSSMRRTRTNYPAQRNRSAFHNTSWMEAARCRGETDTFLAASEDLVATRQAATRRALSICDQCDVSVQCRDYARQNEEVGIWGGETESSRSRFLRKRKR